MIPWKDKSAKIIIPLCLSESVTHEEKGWLRKMQTTLQGSEATAPTHERKNICTLTVSLGFKQSSVV